MGSTLILDKKCQKILGQVFLMQRRASYIVPTFYNVVKANHKQNIKKWSKDLRNVITYQSKEEMLNAWPKAIISLFYKGKGYKDEKAIDLGWGISISFPFGLKKSVRNISQCQKFTPNLVWGDKFFFPSNNGTMIIKEEKELMVLFLCKG